MDAFSFTVDGPPVPQPRIRATRQGHVYTPSGAVGPYKAAIGLQAAATARRHGWKVTEGPVQVWIECVFARPPSHLTASGELRKTAPPFPGLRNGDVDNLGKAVLDAITRGGGVWKDDAQVVELTVAKRYGAAGRTAVEIRRL